MAKKIELMDGLVNGNEAKISLYFKADGSDKEYHIQITKDSDGTWNVPFQYGKRGKALRNDIKNKVPLDWQQAAELYTKTARGQLSSGYTINSTGAAYTGTPLGARLSGITPMLLNSVEEEDFLPLANDDNWLYQEKFDGERLMIRKNADGTLDAINKKGLLTSIPETISKAALSLKADTFIIDTEWLGPRCAPFDALEINGIDLREFSTTDRKSKLDALISTAQIEHQSAFIHVHSALDTTDKTALYARVRDGGGEGVVAKRKDSTYASGRPNSGGPQLKRKFFESATLIAGSVRSDKRSIEVYALDENSALVDLGFVTIPPNFDIPQPDSIVEIHYLYCYTGGKLFTTSYKGPRFDQDRSDCVLTQLKYKRDDDGPTQLPTDAALANIKRNPKM